MTYTAGPLDGAHAQLWSTATFLGLRYRSFTSAAAPASTAWPANNDAVAVPFLVSTPVTFVRAYFISGSTPGTTNYDLGIYNDTFGLIRSIGATACVNSSTAVQPVGGAAFTTPVTLTRGRYFMAMSAAATSMTVRAQANAVQIYRAFGLFKMASAHPLPTTFVPAAMATSGFMPSMGLLTAASIILA